MDYSTPDHWKYTDPKAPSKKPATAGTLSRLRTLVIGTMLTGIPMSSSSSAPPSPDPWDQKHTVDPHKNHWDYI